MGDDRFLAALLSVPVLSGPEVSPDGRWVVWSWSRVGPAADVFAAPTDGSSPPVRLTETSEGDTVVASWTPEGEAVLVTQDTDGDERERLYRVRLAEPGVMEPLTGPSPNYYLHGGQLHPNGRWLVYSANLDAQSGEETEADRLYRHDLESGELLALARPERGSIPWPELNRQGTHVLYSRNELDPAGQQVWLVDIEGREDHEILNFGARAKVSASWFPDGRRVLFVAEAGSYRRVGVWEMEGGVLWLLDDPGRNVEDAFAPPNGGPVVVIEVEGAGIRASLLDPETGEEFAPPEVRGNLVPLARAGGGWVCKRYDARHPVDVIRYDPEGGSTTSLTGLKDRTSLDTDRLAAAEDFRWRSADGLEVQGWLYRAPADVVGTVILVHGGPTSHAEDRFNAEVQYLVSRGFHVMTPNYRGSTGFGLPFQDSIKEDGWGGREQEDIRRGIEALIEAGVARAGRVGITGTSYGGYSAWWAITHFPTDLVAAAAPICGMTDLTVDYHATRPDLRPYSEEMMGGTPEEVPDLYHERSPINFVKDIWGRLLIVQGMQDPNVTPDNVDVVVKALGREGIHYELLTFEDEGHGIARPWNLKVLYPRLADFFEAAFG
ncbi:prolyl oligopeptidase family serine peptidase [Rubrobacter tropicus]|uniref:Prolyl oligopeptidase family serine peptidase n=1 Tax=Rubrobacter tropicus TaxID=2653851 RepID=A0A6G8QCA2_9ACTN|nr:alpha/beta fold hydrolase [Rubrobacter tropicus]QIN84041.1 prolyl oligopeptidase family serine peptidase [Rubrobacter tropicus]